MLSSMEWQRHPNFPQQSEYVPYSINIKLFNARDRTLQLYLLVYGDGGSNRAVPLPPPSPEQ